MPVRGFSLAARCRRAVGNPPGVARSLRARDSCPVPVGVAAISHAERTALLGVFQMGLGLFFLSLGARLIPAVDVAVISQLENVLGPVWVWLAGIEHPAVLTIVGGIVVIGAVAFQITQGGGSPARFHRPPDDLLGDLAGSVADPVLAED